ncbi:uncharacterized protein BP01DRAFT_35963 [Aspergillus saccharolyticus JOP 1030-1]|uniref:Uncharacterized protein n=1 Tax=Aspergillus saccharolyticus JOP 1030-1 TaxID=1450539 RepID=A0A318ZE52_9EURO|nr:hypothetical protein BP01DRAFT_35963 [Aspergillus saccharolyticus JOP 1030-1]PYH45659.1 hypothetical protein BP01DRAFT_35963 [Aspergillus saccharolyticus JOP 1030-1]
MLRNWLVISCRNLGVCSLLSLSHSIFECMFFFFTCLARACRFYYPYSILVSFFQASVLKL